MEAHTKIYDVITGSRAYNLVTPTSDYDHRRVVTPNEYSYFFGLKKFDIGNVITTKEEDNTDYSIQKFIQLALKTNTVALEMLFAPIECVLEVHPLFQKYFLNNREKFITKNLYNVIRGYAFAEHRRALGETTRMLGERRKNDVENLGYSPKNASHCIRLVWIAINTFNTGIYIVKWEDGKSRDFLYKLKTGLITLDEYKYEYELSIKNLEHAYMNCTLPESIDFEFVNFILVEFYKEFFKI